MKKPLYSLQIGLVAVTFSAAALNITAVVAQAIPQPRLPEAKLRLPKAIEVAPAVRLKNRPSLQLFLKLYNQHKDNLPAFRQALITANIKPKVNRICYVFGGYTPQVQCKSLQSIYREEFSLTPSDRAILDLAFNDLLDVSGGSAGSGDLSVCGGTTVGSVTHLQAFERKAGFSASSVSTMIGGGKVQKPSIADATSMLDNCRNAQAASIKGGLGSSRSGNPQDGSVLSTPGDPGYQSAVQNASNFLTGIAANCKDSGNSMIQAPSGDPPSGEQADKSAWEAFKWVAGATQDIAEAAKAAAEVLGGCSSKGKCVAAGVSAVSAAIGLAADANELQAKPNEGLSTVDSVVDVVGAVSAGVAEFGAVTATTAAAEMVLPAAAVGVGAYAIGTVIGNAMADALEPAYEAIQDRSNGVPADKPKQKEGTSSSSSSQTPGGVGGGGVVMPAPNGEGKPTCGEMAAWGERFNAYCSQPGNNWGSYDCMLFVARLNGCVDPALVRPAPGQDFTCNGPTTDRENRIAACKQTEKVRGWLASTISGSMTNGRVFRSASITSPDAASKCGLTIETIKLEQQLQDQICTQVLTGGGDGICSGGLRGQGSRSNIRERN